ncbi:MAG: S1 RNA-binding domain-containing protein, partial [Pseudomonadota bacterium]
TADMLSEIATTISERERRAMAAERETIDRLVAAHLADRIGATFTARISGVTRSGLFVRLDETGADGFVPASSIGDDYYVFDETLRAMIGSRRGAGYQLGDAVEVELVEAAPTAGALRFDMLSDGRPIGGAASGRQGRRPGRHVRGPRGRGAPGPKRVRRKRR